MKNDITQPSTTSSNDNINANINANNNANNSSNSTSTLDSHLHPNLHTATTETSEHPSEKPCLDTIKRVPTEPPTKSGDGSADELAKSDPSHDKGGDKTHLHSAMAQPAPPPDGGLRAWLVVAGGFCAFFVSFGWINCIGVFMDYYKSHQLRELSTSTVTWILSLEIFLMFFGGPFIGILFDSHGPRYILLAGTILHILGLMMVSLSTEYYQFILSQGICSPLGASMIFHGTTNSINTWFRARRALALGLAISGSSLGGVIYPIMVTQLNPRLGFGWTMRIIAFLSLALLFVTNATISSRLAHSSRKPFTLSRFVSPLREPAFALTTAATFTINWAMFLPFTFIPIQAQAQAQLTSSTTSANLSLLTTVTPYLIPILNATSIVGRLGPPYLSDALTGPFNTILLTSIFNTILVSTIWLLSSTGSAASTSGPPLLLAFTAIYGFSSGAAIALTPALVAHITPDVTEIGVRSGTYFAVVAVATLTGSPIGGALIDYGSSGAGAGAGGPGGFWRMQAFCAVAWFVGAGLYAVARGVVLGRKRAPVGGWGWIWAKV